MEKWEKRFVNEINWKDALEATKTAAQSTYSEGQQYKMMHSSIRTNITLVKMKKTG